MADTWPTTKMRKSMIGCFEAWKATGWLVIWPQSPQSLLSSSTQIRGFNTHSRQTSSFKESPPAKLIIQPSQTFPKPCVVGSLEFRPKCVQQWICISFHGKTFITWDDLCCRIPCILFQLCTAVEMDFYSWKKIHHLIRFVLSGNFRLEWKRNLKRRMKISQQNSQCTTNLLELLII